MTSRRRTVLQALMLPPWRLLFSRWPWLALAYVVVSATLSLLIPAVLVATFLLLPLWGLLCGAFERRRSRMLGFPRQGSGHVRVASGERHNWLNIRLTEPATWRETAVLVVDIVFGALCASAVFWEAMALVVLVGVPLSLREREGSVLLFNDVRLELGPHNWWWPLTLILVFLPLAAYLNMALAAAQASAVRWLLRPRRAEIDLRIERLTRSRAAIVSAHEEERRRIERDLHDGVQQELVVLAAGLGVLELELSALGPEAGPARRALSTAQDQAERATSTLRSTVRGIHPAVLTDRGLGAALDELAGRAPIPVRIDHEHLARMPAALETTAYFMVTEALTNAAKHTDATLVTVSARSSTRDLEVVVTDNGPGGADPERGTGLRGLSERAATLEGRLTIDSPLGGPTALSLTLPQPQPQPQPQPTATLRGGNGELT